MPEVMVPICPIGGAQHKAYPASSPDPYAPWLDSHKTYYGIFFAVTAYIEDRSVSRSKDPRITRIDSARQLACAIAKQPNNQTIETHFILRF
jgi:hypothetical protein